ncbi:MAG: M23 family metallopeptidase [Pseudomonadota bacterium]
MPFLPLVFLLGLTACAAGTAARQPAVPAAAAATSAAVPAEVAAPSVQLRGEFRQGELIVGRVPPGSRVRVLERNVRVAADGTFVFGLDRDAAPEIVVDIVLPDGQVRQEKRAVAAREYNIQRVTGIPERIMRPSPADLERIARDNAQVARARRIDDDRLDFLGPFIWPAQGPITGVFGSQRFYNGEPKRPHFGVDVGVPTGTPVLAPAGGIVTVAAPDMFYSGGTLVIDHGHGVSSTLMHLSELLVREGERVERGQLVAKSGASGRASGPHLDWRMNWFGEYIDAQRLVPPMPSEK